MVFKPDGIDPDFRFQCFSGRTYDLVQSGDCDQEAPIFMDVKEVVNLGISVCPSFASFQGTIEIIRIVIIKSKK